MIDPTNILTAAPATTSAAAAQVAQSTFNAWHVVALGVGAAVGHAYATIVHAGGVKQIWSNFWSGPQNPAPNERNPNS